MMKLEITNHLGLPVVDATVMVIDAPQEIHDIAALTNNDGIVNLADYTTPGSYRIMISTNEESVTRTVELHDANETVFISI